MAYLLSAPRILQSPLTSANELRTHQVEQVDEWFRCKDCVKSASNAEAFDKCDCPGVDTRIANIHSSHVIFVAGRVLFCPKCGCSSDRKVVNLRRACGAKAGDSRQRARAKSFWKGVHPDTGEVLGAVRRLEVA